MKTKLLMCLAVLAIALPVSSQQSTPALNLLPPERTPVAFYKWYLHALAQNEVPTDELNGPIKGYLSARLIASLKIMLRKGDINSDYFLQAQDFLPDWEPNVAASEADVRGREASTVITLGNAPASKHRLSIALVMEGNSWKIASVRRVN